MVTDPGEVEGVLIGCLSSVRGEKAFIKLSAVLICEILITSIKCAFLVLREKLLLCLEAEKLMAFGMSETVRGCECNTVL